MNSFLLKDRSMLTFSSELKELIEHLLAFGIFGLHINHLQPLLIPQTRLVPRMNRLESPYIPVSNKVLLSVLNALVVHGNEFVNLVKRVISEFHELLDVVDAREHDVVAGFDAVHLLLALQVGRGFLSQVGDHVLTGNDVADQVPLDIDDQLTQPIASHTHVEKVRVLLPCHAHVQVWWP